jgi:hypothetical protein
MSHAISPIAVDFAEAVKNLVTEDDQPVDNLFSAKQQRLLVTTLYCGYTPPEEDLPEHPGDSEPPLSRKFLADANVGVFISPYLPPLVPDAFLSLDVEPHPDWHMEEHRAYFIWEFEKPPDVVVEIVSNRTGHELDEKRRRYAKMGVMYYVVFDPWRHLSDEVLRVYERGFGNRYRQRPDFVLPEAGLQVTLWQGVFEDWKDTWLRWCDREGKLIATPEERAISAEERAVFAEERAISAEERAARLAAQLRALGVEPDKL